MHRNLTLPFLKSCFLLNNSLVLSWKCTSNQMSYYLFISEELYLDGLHIVTEVQVKLWSNSTRVYTVMNASHSITLTCHVLMILIPSKTYVSCVAYLFVLNRGFPHCRRFYKMGINQHLMMD